MNRLCSNTLAVLLVASAALSACGDVVTMTDGSRILGTVESMAGGKLILLTEFAGTLEIDATLVASIQVDRKVNVGMDTGDRLVGPIKWRSGLDRATVETEFGGVPVDVQRIDAIWPEGGKSPEMVAMEEQIAEAREEAEAAKGRWELTIEAGLNYEEGNSERFGARGRIEARRIWPRDLLKLFIAGDYAEEYKIRSTSEAMAGAYFEHMFTERVFGYARTEFEYDEFENLDLRASVGGGAGYYWIKKPEHELKTRAGLGYLHESFMDGYTRDSAEAELGLDYRLDVTPWMQFVHGMTYYPTFDGIDDYRLVSDSAFVIPLGKSDAWKLKLGALYEYKSQPPPDVDRLDQTYYANIVLELK
jgi:putative salt-induced outer membrane protein YdiY